MEELEQFKGENTILEEKINNQENKIEEIKLEEIVANQNKEVNTDFLFKLRNLGF